MFMRRSVLNWDFDMIYSIKILGTCTTKHMSKIEVNIPLKKSGPRCDILQGLCHKWICHKQGSTVSWALTNSV